MTGAFTAAGIDLAWTPHHPSGVCIVRFESPGADGELLELSSRTGTPLEFADAIANHDGDIIAAIDAPLVLCDDRVAERALARVYARAKAAPYQANEAFLVKFNGFAGPLLMAELRTRGFEHGLPVAQDGRWAVEVYPHAAHVSLFALAERIRYKKGRLDARRDGLREYQLLLATLFAKQWPWAANEERIMRLLDPVAVGVPGRPMKALEDQLDALTCAYTAWHLWTHGAAGRESYGAPETGLIAVPSWPVTLA